MRIMLHKIKCMQLKKWPIFIEILFCRLNSLQYWCTIAWRDCMCQFDHDDMIFLLNIYITKQNLGVGRVCFSGLGSGYGFWDLARVGSRVSGYWARVNEIWFGSNSGQVFFSFFSQCWLNLAKNSNINRWWSSACKNYWQKWWSSACQIKLLLDFGLSGWTKLYLGLLGFIKKLFGSGRVGQNSLGSGFGPTHP